MRAVARDIFGCDTLSGAELENQPTGAGCYGSHWEQRNSMHEVMAATTVSSVTVYSALTLAALEDSGWYRANYSLTDPVLWGRRRGCGFVDSLCVQGGAASDSTWCVTPASPCRSCHPHRTALGDTPHPTPQYGAACQVHHPR